MKSHTTNVRSRWKHLILAAGLTVLLAGTAPAAIIVSEVSPTGSSNALYSADWFELTNTGAVAQSILGWKVDDNSDAFGTAVALRGVTSIDPGQSVVFIEGNTSGSNDATKAANFINFWFNGVAPAGLVIGGYGGSGVSLSSSGDHITIFDSLGTLVTGVAFDASTLGVSFDNAAGLGSSTLPPPTISTLSVAGVNGAFNSFQTPTEIGSPGAIVPEPGSALLLCLGAGLVALARIAKVRRRMASA